MLKPACWAIRILMELSVVLLELMFAVGFVIVALDNLEHLTGETRLVLATLRWINS